MLTQSLAIIEYLEERYPEPPLLPAGPADRARVRALAQIVACDVHPINNLRVLQYLEKDLGVDEDARAAWARHWIDGGFAAVEAMLRDDPRTGDHCFGDRPTLADVCLVPQVFNSRRFDVDMARYPTLARINENCIAAARVRRSGPRTAARRRMTLAPNRVVAGRRLRGGPGAGGGADARRTAPRRTAHRRGRGAVHRPVGDGRPA